LTANETFAENTGERRLPPIFVGAMKFSTKAVAPCFGLLCAIVFVQAAAGADADDVATGTNSPIGRYGLFNGLDHSSVYTKDAFPNPFLVEDVASEDTELELNWLHTRAGDKHSDTGSVEIQKGIGVLTLEASVPYVNSVKPDESIHGLGNIDLGARYPLYQYVSANHLIDSTFGIGMEADIATDSTVSRNGELEPEIFNALALGQHFTMQTVLGWGGTTGGGDNEGEQDFDYGFSLAWQIPHAALPIPGTEQFIPMVEISGERGLNRDEAGKDNVLGDVGFRAQCNGIGDVRPWLGFAGIFPLDNGARKDVHWGFEVSAILEF
jgi:hypothetical protein